MFTHMRFGSLAVKAYSFVLIISFFCVPVFGAFTLDPTFGNGGKVLISFPDSSANYSSEGLRIFVQPSGRIVVGGIFTRATSDGQLPGVVVTGLLANGTVDSTYGPGGSVQDWQSNGFTSLTDALTYSDGRFLRISRFFNVGGSSTVRAARLNVDGTNDGVFSSNVSIGAGGGFGTARPVRVSVTSEGKVLALITDNGNFFLYRLNADGTRDTTFGVNGINPVRFSRIPMPSDFQMEMVVLNDGKILIVGHVPPFNSPNGSSKFFLARLTETGIPDKSFSRLGFVQVEFGAGLTGHVRRAMVQPDGQILLCGSVFGPDTDLWMARFRTNGQPDTTFGSNGVVISDLLPGGTDVARSITLSSDNKIRVAGWVGSPTSFLVARFSSSGSLEESTTIPFTPNQFSWANDVILQTDGKLLVAGRTENPDSSINGGVFAIARLTE